MYYLYLTVSKTLSFTHSYTFFQPCNCPAACKYTTYDVTTSYLEFPAATVARQFAKLYNKTVEDIFTNYLQLNIFYKSQNTEVEETTDAYSGTALLSDIGGLLGLFIGMSVISMFEFGIWIVDEIKDRCFGMNDKKLEEWYEIAEAEVEAWEKSAKRESNANSAVRVESGGSETSNTITRTSIQSITPHDHDAQMSIEQ